MTNTSIKAAFERFWYHVVARLNGYATIETLDAHTTDTSNPHSVTKAQIGLGNVNNTADSNKSVKYATSAGSAETATKATQDASGNTITDTYATKTELNTLSDLVGDTAVSTQIDTALDGYVAKEDGKDLSTNNFVDGEQIRMSHLYGTIPAGTVFYEGKVELTTEWNGQLYGNISEGDKKMVAVTSNNNYFVNDWPYTITINDQEYVCQEAGWIADAVDTYSEGIGILNFKDSTSAIQGSLAMSNLEGSGREMMLMLKDTTKYAIGDTVTVKIACQNDLAIDIPNEYLNIDAELSETSTGPVQNQAVKAAIEDLQTQIDALKTLVGDKSVAQQIEDALKS